MDVKTVLALSVTSAMSPVLLNAAIDEHEPACGIEARQPGSTELACSEKRPQMHHAESDVPTLPFDGNYVMNLETGYYSTTLNLIAFEIGDASAS